MKNYYLAMMSMLIFYSVNIFSMETSKKSIDIDLSRNSNQLTVEVINSSDSFFKINSRFFIDPVAGVIHFVFKVGGKEKNLIAQINSENSQPSDYLSLSPGSFYGKKFDLDHMKKIYGVDEKCYTFYVYYFDAGSKNFEALGDKIYSKQLKICR